MLVAESKYLVDINMNFEAWYIHMPQVSLSV